MNGDVLINARFVFGSPRDMSTLPSQMLTQNTPTTARARAQTHKHMSKQRREFYNILYPSKNEPIMFQVFDPSFLFLGSLRLRLRLFMMPFYWILSVLLMSQSIFLIFTLFFYLILKGFQQEIS